MGCHWGELMSEIDICTDCQRIIPKGKALCKECLEKREKAKQLEAH